jgi:hypothetical protein
VRVVAFRGDHAQTLAALQKAFALNSRAAQQVIDTIPAVVKHGVPAAQARTYQQALQKVGAEVFLDRVQSQAAPQPPAPKRPPEPGGAPRPPPRVAPPSAARPKEIVPPPSAAGPRAGRAVPAPARHRHRPPSSDLELDLQADSSAGQVTPAGSARRVAPRAGDFREADLGAEAASGSVGPGESGDHDDLRDKVVFGADVLGLPTGAAVGQATYAAGAGPAPASAPASASTRAEVRAKLKAQNVALPSLRIPLLRVLSAVAIVALGVWVDNSILYGSANWLGVGAHAVAIYLLGLGLKGIFA